MPVIGPTRAKELKPQKQKELQAEFNGPSIIDSKTTLELKWSHKWWKQFSKCPSFRLNSSHSKNGFLEEREESGARLGSEKCS